MSTVAIRKFAGTGSPEGVITAPPGSTYSQGDALSGNELWDKATGIGNTGWRIRGGSSGGATLDANGDLLVGATGSTLATKEYMEFKTDGTSRLLLDTNTILSSLEKRGTGVLVLKANNNQLLTSNSDVSSSAWTKTSVTVTTDATTDYDGTNLADLVVGSANVSSLVSQDFISYAGSGKTLVFGVYLKATTTHTARIATFIYDNTWTSLQGFQTDVVVDNTWRYFEQTSTFGTFATASRMNVAVRPDVSGSTNNGVYIYNAQLREQITVSSFPSVTFMYGDEVLLSATGVTDSLRSTLSLSF